MEVGVNSIANDEQEKIAFLALSAVGGISSSSLRQIYRSNYNFYSFFNASSTTDFNLIARDVGIKIRFSEKMDWNDYKDKLLGWGQTTYLDLVNRNIKLIFDCDHDFPQTLKNLNDPVYWLFIQGNLSLLNSNLVAAIGTRKPSVNGLFLSECVGLALRDINDVGVVSGLAPGIDQSIHWCTMIHRIKNIAVLGTGILFDFPQNSGGLKEDILNYGGALVSEYLPYDKYSKVNFVRRNRIQAALAKVVIPVEWKLQSGTAHTIRFAVEMGKNVLGIAYPGTEDDDEFCYIKNNWGQEHIFTLPHQYAEFVAAIKNAVTNDSTSLITNNEVNLFNWKEKHHELLS